MDKIKISPINIVIGVIVVGGILLATILFLLPDSDDSVVARTFYEKKTRVHTDHTNMIAGPFEDGPSVTRECLSCHPEAGQEMLRTRHWEWLGPESEISGHPEPTRIGKANLINNFCIGVQNNWVKCVSCHAGYGWADANYDFSNEENIDCLICHDSSGQYAKGDYGFPKKGVDLLTVAKSVTTPGRNNCGACHFNGGGGNGVKHGDLDGSLIYPTERIDVHMGRYDMVCVDCHRTRNHKIAGRSLGVSVDNHNRVLCLDCHREDLHKDERINAHTSSVSCNTCHIPEFAKDDPTKMTWDWSTAGQDLDINDSHVYLKIKGSFTYARKVTPQYYWYNGKSDRYLLGDTIDPSQTTPINYPHGSIHDREARLYPFKIHYTNQPYDKKYNYFHSPTTAGEGGYWHEFNWDKALRLGSEATGLPFSGQYGFARSEMFWKTSHMVSPKEDALQCVDCHDDNGRLDWQALGYEGDPIGRGDRKRLGLLDATKTIRINGGGNG